MADDDPRGSDKIRTMTESDQNERDESGGESTDVVMARSQAKLAEIAAKHDVTPEEGKPVVLAMEEVAVAYSGAVAIRGVNLEIHKGLVTAFIGPSGCGKTTLLRSLNRLNDLIPGAVVEGTSRGSTRSRYGAGSGWSSSGPTRSPSRSSTTSPSAFACTE